MTGKSSLYATAAPHYEHVIAAMLDSFATVSLMRRFEVNPRAYALIAKLPFARRGPAQILGRRVRERPSVTGRVHGLGAGQFVWPAAARVSRAPSSDLTRSLIRRRAARVARIGSAVDVLQFEEGLGQVVLARRDGGSIMERRGLHSRDLEATLEPVSDFPYVDYRDPLADVYELEYESSDYVMTYSTAQRDSLVTHGVAANKIVTIPLPVHLRVQPKSLPRDPRVALAIGRLTQDRGLDVAIAAAQRTPSIDKLIVAGPAPNPEVIDWLRSQPKVEYVGIADAAHLGELYSTAGVMICPSMESFGLAVVEATAHGLHVMCRETTGAAEYLSHDATTVVEGRDPDAWALRIEEYLQSHDWATREADPRPSTGSDVPSDSPLSLASIVRKYSDFYGAILNG